MNFWSIVSLTDQKTSQNGANLLGGGGVNKKRNRKLASIVGRRSRARIKKWSGPSGKMALDRQHRQQSNEQANSCQVSLFVLHIESVFKFDRPFSRPMSSQQKSDQIEKNAKTNQFGRARLFAMLSRASFSSSIVCLFAPNRIQIERSRKRLAIKTNLLDQCVITRLQSEKRLSFEYA